MSETQECAKGTDSNLRVNQTHLILCHLAKLKVNSTPVSATTHALEPLSML